jgi:predicted alpha/beta-hydrolase family hydrolase
VPVEPEQLSVKISEREHVTALRYSASKKNRVAATILLAHGAGSNQLSSFMQLFANGLSARGFDSMTFNFAYMEQGRRVPDQKAKLESCYRAVIDEALTHKKLKNNRLVIGGKSMGGRIASQVAAADAEKNEQPGDKISGLVFLGYPLHPPGNPEKLRAEHLKNIRVPMLFVQGTRDSLGRADEIGATIKQLHLPATLYEIEGGDHSFKVPKSATVAQEQVYELALDEIARWIQLQNRER